MYGENARQLLEKMAEDESLLAEIVCLGDPRAQLDRLVEMGEEMNLPIADREESLYRVLSVEEGKF